jgi:alkylation response protein AidB-like acyl-CoA dehydrogenase
VFTVPLHLPGIEIHRIEMLNGSDDFCQEFFTDVRIPDSCRIGEVDEGWTVATRWMYHERTVSGGSPYVTRPAGGDGSHEAGLHGGGGSVLALARKAGKLGDDHARQLVGEAHTLGLVRNALTGRMASMARQGTISEHAGAVFRLFSGRTAVRTTTIAYELAGPAAAVWEASDEAFGRRGVDYLIRQASCIGGGTTEMAANAVSERLLGMPRERTLDRDVPFRDIPKGPPAGSR